MTTHTGGRVRPTHLQRLEAESIQIMREAVADSEWPVTLYSVGKTVPRCSTSPDDAAETAIARLRSTRIIT